MRVTNYEITDAVAGFDEGDILDVTARFGDWHTYELKLERGDGAAGSRTVVVTSSDGGFSEAEILDETARIGDWHEYDLKFDPTAAESETASGRVRLTAEQFEAIAEPVDASA